MVFYLYELYQVIKNLKQVIQHPGAWTMFRKIDKYSLESKKYMYCQNNHKEYKRTIITNEEKTNPFRINSHKINTLDTLSKSEFEDNVNSSEIISKPNQFGLSKIPIGCINFGTFLESC